MHRSKTGVLLIASALTLAACSGTTNGTAADPTDVPASPSTTPTTPATTTTLAADTEPIDVIGYAVEEVLNAGSYALEVVVELEVKGDITETELEGWVDGSDRELTMTVGRESVTTRVIDGIATVERDGVITEVPLQEVGDSPSLEILNELNQAVFVSDTEITGALNASALKASGFDVNGTAIVTVYLTVEGSLAGYTMIGNNGSWAVDVRFFDIGQSFDG
jgi:hypothetical protein